MSRTAVFQAPFDPVTRSEIDFAKSLLRSEGYKEVVFVVEGEGVLPAAERYTMLAQAIKPWRKMSLEQKEGVIVRYENAGPDEEMVRQGKFYLGANGIRKTLVEKGYYLDEVLTHACKPGRAEHARAVAMLAEEIALANHLDGKKAYRMGMLHDITKNKDDEENRRLLAIYAPELLSYGTKVWHSFTAPIIMHKELCIYDRQMLKAVWCHTLGDGTGLYDKILFAADKIEPTRGYDSSREIALCITDIQAGFLLVKEENEAYLRKEGIYV